MRHLILATAGFLAGCAQSTPIYGPDGKQAHLIECPGAAVPMSACFSKANETCPAGYVLLNRDQSGGALAVTQGSAFAATGIQKSIVVRCN